MSDEQDPSVFLRASKTQDDQARLFDTKKWIWVVDDDEGFKPATIKDQTGDNVVVEMADGQVSRDLLATRKKACIIYFACSCAHAGAGV